MRYIILAFIVCTLVVVGIAGRQGDKTRRPPIELIPDMDRQPKLRPQAENAFFKDGRSSQLPPSGTIARDSNFQDLPVNTGRLPGTTNFVDTIPVPVTAQLMARGRDRYDIYCLPCHGAVGDGKGVTSKLGMGVIA
ncbi:MAG: cytochrome c, partial [Verrucomicrobia bacterium]|nr:cytochrome c [Verrucomicrobiota bacterium]